VLYEVYRKIERERGEETALLFSNRLSTTQVVQLTESIALLAADLRLRHVLAMADAIVYATGKDQEAQVVTGDADLKDLPGVVYASRCPRQSSGPELTSMGDRSNSSCRKCRMSPILTLVWPHEVRYTHS
jgi:hypothetical protein